MDRRELLVGAGALALASIARGAPPAKAAAAPSLADAASECERKAEACLTHCLMMFGSGDTSMAACAAAVRETLATSHALATLAAANSKHAKELAQVCKAVCKDCEAECRKHEAKMPVCKECADACAKMIAAIDKA